MADLMLQIMEDFEQCVRLVVITRGYETGSIRFCDVNIYKGVFSGHAPLWQIPKV